MTAQRQPANPVPLHLQDTPAKPQPSIPSSALPEAECRPLTNNHKPEAPERALTIAGGGTWAKLRYTSNIPARGKVPVRGRVHTFSQASRSRMIQAMCKIDREALPPGILFETLTYPKAYTEAPEDWHKHLESWGRKLKRRFPDCFFFWKLEFQKRGAPHFHLLIFGIPWEPAGLQFLNLQMRKWWYETVGSSDRKHGRRGAHLEVVNSLRQVIRYTSKYVGKLDNDAPGQYTGRIWGIFNRAKYPTKLQTVVVSEREFFILRRVFRRFMGQHRGFFRPGGANSGVWAALSGGAAKRCLDNCVAEAPWSTGVEILFAVIPTNHGEL